MPPATLTVLERGVGDDVRVIGLVGFGHFVSHFFQLALPPLFPVPSRTLSARPSSPLAHAAAFA